MKKRRNNSWNKNKQKISFFQMMEKEKTTSLKCQKDVVWGFVFIRKQHKKKKEKIQKKNKQRENENKRKKKKEKKVF